ncbi:MAG: hypothetical protein FJ144_05730 [Deltaproteobacteria bacterium]|nr:hypothetical protein [Deltaproteobacteria bacterium]
MQASLGRMKPTLARGTFALAFSLTLSLALAPAALAAPDPSPTPAFQKAFQKADENGDGKLSPDEAKKAGFFSSSAADFKSADGDADGQVTLFELGKAVAQSASDSMSTHEKADKNKDGVVDKDEAATLGEKLEGVFTNADENKDGMVDRGEMMNQVTNSYYSEDATEPVVPNIINEKF